MGHSGDPRPQSLGRKDHTLGHCGLGLGGTVATPSHWHGRGSTFNVQLEYSFVSILSAREIVDCPRRTRNGIPVGPHVGRFRSHSSTFNVQPPLPPRISSIVYIPNLVRLIVVDGRTTQVASLSRCNHRLPRSSMYMSESSVDIRLRAPWPTQIQCSAAHFEPWSRQPSSEDLH